MDKNKKVKTYYQSVHFSSTVSNKLNWFSFNNKKLGFLVDFCQNFMDISWLFCGYFARLWLGIRSDVVSHDLSMKIYQNSTKIRYKIYIGITAAKRYTKKSLKIWNSHEPLDNNLKIDISERFQMAILHQGAVHIILRRQFCFKKWLRDGKAPDFGGFGTPMHILDSLKHSFGRLLPNIGRINCQSLGL